MFTFFALLLRRAKPKLIASPVTINLLFQITMIPLYTLQTKL
ncbi:hypothetical protein Patl1_17652 [Pistacia atlantica]|uniref:Uncharacterized protein n=1 Tax=Pistacia atlantica TaxID=434234 RepID=A0ACC1C0E8_9ROSI|nr:hypothetical protein Patl1_17652 [Pistacia atlantica]